MGRPFNNHYRYPTPEHRALMRNKLRRELFERQSGMCWICGKKMVLEYRGKKPPRTFASFDHVKPQTHGGTAYHTNLKLAHRMCNSARGSPVSESDGRD